LLDGIPLPEKRNRLAVLVRLAGKGVSTADIIEAARSRRLAYLLLETSLIEPGPRFTLSEISNKAELPHSDVARWFRAVGRGVATADDRAYGLDDLHLARHLLDYRRLGVDDPTLFSAARAVGRNTWAVADAVEQLIVRRLADAADRPEIADDCAHEMNRFAEFQAHRPAAPARRRSGTRPRPGSPCDHRSDGAPQREDVLPPQARRLSRSG
jgi:adenylate cyclase